MVPSSGPMAGINAAEVGGRASAAGAGRADARPCGPSPGTAAAQLAGFAAERPLQPACVGLPARQLSGGDRARAGGEDVEQHLRDQRRPSYFGGPVPCIGGLGVGRHQTVELGGQLRVALHDRVDGGLWVQQRGGQADVLDHGEARGFQRALFLVVEEPGEEPPVQDLTPVVLGIRLRALRGLKGLRGRVLGRSFCRVLRHFRSSLPARSRSTATASVAAFSALTAGLVRRTPRPSPGVDRDGLLPYGRLDGQGLDAVRPGVPTKQSDARAGCRDGLGGEWSGGRNAVDVDGERASGEGERQCVVVLVGGVALQEHRDGYACRMPVQGSGRRVTGGGQGDAGGGEGVGGLALACVLVAPDQVALGGDRHVGEVHRAAFADGCQERHVRAEQLPEACSDDRVGLRHRYPGAHQTRRGAVRGLEHRVDLGLHGGRVFMDVYAEGQEAPGGRTCHGHIGCTGHGEQQRA